MTNHVDSVLRVEGLTVRIATKEGVANAVDNVSLSVRAGEVVAVVGESGSGKSLTALSIMGLHPAAATIIDGEVVLNGRSLSGISSAEWSTIRGNEIAMILQDPLTALNPVFTIGNQVAEGPRHHQSLRGKDLQARVIELLESVQIPQPAARIHDFPHQFSGGMRQRVVGAIAIACNPDLLIADEPTTSLDVTVEDAYLQLLQKLQVETNVGILLITHDFGIVHRLADRVAVMYSGKVLETGLTDDIVGNQAHPYTEALVRSVPDIHAPPSKRLLSIVGSPPSLFESKPACHFAPRCAYVMDHCWTKVPPDVEVKSGHVVKCWRYA